MLSLRQVVFMLVGFVVCQEKKSTVIPQVSSPAGTFLGKVLTSSSGAKFASYRGIPFALPPIGDRRFALPEPFPKTKNVIYHAADFGPKCVQSVGRVTIGNEDCLFLNVYTPLNAKDAQEAKPMKVLVFIYGGGFVIGSTNMYIPGDLVSKENVVVVTPNYRLGWFGFLRGDPESAPGNQAFWDQVLALRWVKENIQAFGGDPDDVTIAGESAGSLSVSLLAISPLTNNLFTKGILMSGTAFSFRTPHQTSTDFLEQLSTSLDCGREADIVQCLKQKPVDRFQLNFTSALMANLPSSGDAFLPEPIPKIVNDQTYLNEVGFFDRSYIVSITKHDGYVRVGSLFGKINTVSLESSISDMAKLLQFPEFVTESLIQEYLKLYDNLELAIIAINTDYFYVKRSNRFLEAYNYKSQLEKTSPNKNAYLMSFDPSPQFFQNQYAAHAVDLLYLFDIEPKEIADFYFSKIQGDMSEEDLKVKADYCTTIAAFMKTGNPNEFLKQEKDVEWPPYENTHKSYISFSQHPSIHEDMFGARREIWEKSVGQWKREYEHLELKQEL